MYLNGLCLWLVSHKPRCVGACHCFSYADLKSVAWGEITLNGYQKEILMIYRAVYQAIPSQHSDLFCPPLECVSVLLCVFACLYVRACECYSYAWLVIILSFEETIHNNNSWKWKTLEKNEITCTQILFGLWLKPGTSAVRPKRATNGAINGWEMELSASVNVSWGVIVKVNKQ